MGMALPSAMLQSMVEVGAATMKRIYRHAVMFQYVSGNAAV